MEKHDKLVKDLRDTERVCRDRMDGQVMLDSAAAIEELSAEVSDKDYLIQQQTHEIQRLMADVERQQKKMIDLAKRLPKRGEWIELEDRNERKYSHICSACHHFNIAEGEVEFYHYCPNCGAKMEVQE